MKTRSNHGSVFIELGLLSVVLVAVAILCLDIGMVAWGTSRNDEACRDAARAAADGRDKEEAMKRADAALIAHAADGVWLTNPKLETSAFVYQDFRSANPGGGNAPDQMPSTPPPGEGPYVTVVTSSDIRVPVPLSFLGANFGKEKLHAVKSFSFPLISVQIK